MFKSIYARLKMIIVEFCTIRNYISSLYVLTVVLYIEFDHKFRKNASLLTIIVYCVQRKTKHF